MGGAGERLGALASARRLYLFLSIVYTASLLLYYYTGRGGPILLASVMVPFSALLAVMGSYLEGGPLRRLGRRANQAIVAAYLALAVAVPAYIVSEFEELNTVRFGSYNEADVAVGLAAFASIMAITALRYPAIFLVNALLLIYALDGSWAPYPFDHPGISPERIVTAMSVEFETGVFEKLPQLALTLIGAFMLYVSIAHSFGLVDSIIRIVVSAAGRRPRLIPQAAVIGSMSIAMVSGSGAANTASTGSITIPLMKRVGLDPVRAASIETASSIGGQLMPPIMGISAFIMADYLGVAYFDVVVRGWAVALVYYIGVAVAVYYASRAIRPPRVGVAGVASRLDYARGAVFLLGIASLIILMGVRREYPALAALQASALILALSIAIEAYRAGPRGLPRALASRLGEAVRTFVGFTVDITILLSALGVMTGLLTITGIPTRVGFLLLEYGAGEVALLALLSFAFGYIVGLGLPPVVTYILTVIVIAPYMVQAGVDPWVIHFYAFLLGVMSELSPPTSVTAAVTSRLAGAGFTRTMIESLKTASPLFILMPALFLEPGLVAEPGLGQLRSLASTAIATILIVTGLGLRLDSRIQYPLRAAAIMAGLAVLYY